jgi:hypothetical protein
MTRIVVFSALLGLTTGSTMAADVAMMRVLSCKSGDAAMEVFIPQSVIKGRGAANANIAQPTVGVYTLDLTEAGKGKVLESVRISVTADKKSVIVDQYTRKLPPTRVPVSGGTVNFDNRFGANAKCGAFNSE